jgi:hypothetical protein
LKDRLSIVTHFFNVILLVRQSTALLHHAANGAVVLRDPPEPLMKTVCDIIEYRGLAMRNTVFRLSIKEPSKATVS